MTDADLRVLLLLTKSVLTSAKTAHLTGSNMKLYQKLVVATAVSTFFAVMEASPLQAATITYDFKADVTSGSLLGQTFTGFLSYDDSALTGVGSEFFGSGGRIESQF